MSINNIRKGDLLTYDRKDGYLTYGERYEVMDIEKAFGNKIIRVSVMTKWGFGAWYGINKFKTITVARNNVINDILR